MPLSTGKKLLFSLVGFVVLPLLVLGAAELALRLAGYGYRTSFFKEIRIGQKQMLAENDKFGLRFFPPEMARSPAPVVMPAKKAPGTYRIFIFGESAALGDPRPAFGAARYLEKLLVDRYPSTHFEVICTAMTAINSHTILPIARECARYEADLWLIYMGNNEMVGPFGAASVFGSRAPSVGYVRFMLAVQQFRLGQLLMSTVRRLAGRSSGRLEWGGMSMFLKNQVAPVDPRKGTVYQNFKRNLEDILKTGHRAGARVLLNTVAVNLKDCAPFASVSGLPPEGQTRLRNLLTNGLAAELNSKESDARRCYQETVALAKEDAEANFRLGVSLLGASDPAQALRHLELARDLDALPFRADSRINGLIRDAAARGNGGKLAFFDAERWLGTNAPAGALGDEMFYEHVHFNSEGNFRLGLAWAEQVASLLPPGLKNGDRGAWLSREDCERKLGLTDWNRLAIYQDVLRRLREAPFTNQSNHGQQVKYLQALIAETRKRLTPENAKAAQALYIDALREAPDDHHIHESFAEFLEATGQFPTAFKEWDYVRQLLPQHHVAYYQCGWLAQRQGNLDQAEQLLTKAVTLRPDLAEGWLHLGQVQALKGNHQQAMKFYERELRLAPRDERVYYHLGRACSNLGRREQAVAYLKTALQLRPDFWEAHYALGEELAFSGQPGPARKEFLETLRLKPDYAMAHFNLAVALLKSGEREPALKHLEEARRLDPANRQVTETLQKLTGQ